MFNIGDFRPVLFRRPHSTALRLGIFVRVLLGQTSAILWPLRRMHWSRRLDGQWRG